MQTATFKTTDGKEFAVTFNGHIQQIEYKPAPEYVPYLWELWPEERAERLARLREALA